jgi:hypothetical protein
VKAKCLESHVILQVIILKKVFSTLVYLMENLNLKDELRNYYFSQIKDLIEKVIIQGT